MSSQLGAISSINGLIGKIFTQPKGDLAGRLNSRITVAILAVSSGLLLTTHFWGDPITCWTPAEFTKIWADFVNQYCYVHGTYFSNLDQPLDFNQRERQRVSIDYYQWVPYVLAIQALFFYTPRFIWKILSGFSACVEIMEHQAAGYLWDGIRLSKRRNRGRLSLHYVIYTFAQAINASLMFMWLNTLIDSPIYSWSGPSIIVDLYNGLTWQETGHFPRITHCDFTRRKLASVQTETVLCVLTLNIYYEKLLLFLWFWMLMVAVISWMNCISWARVMCMPHASKVKLQSFLTIHSGSSVYVDRFFRALGADGIFILHQISLNIGDLPTSYLTLAMYNIIDQSENELRHLLEKDTKAV